MFGIGNVAIGLRFRYMNLYNEAKRNYSGKTRVEIQEDLQKMNPLEKGLSRIPDRIPFFATEPRARYVAAQEVLKTK